MFSSFSEIYHKITYLRFQLKASLVHLEFMFMTIIEPPSVFGVLPMHSDNLNVTYIKCSSLF